MRAPRSVPRNGPLACAVRRIVRALGSRDRWTRRAREGEPTIGWEWKHAHLAPRDQTRSGRDASVQKSIQHRAMGPSTSMRAGILPASRSAPTRPRCARRAESIAPRAPIACHRLRSLRSARSVGIRGSMPRLATSGGAGAVRGPGWLGVGNASRDCLKIRTRHERRIAESMPERRKGEGSRSRPGHPGGDPQTMPYSKTEWPVPAFLRPTCAVRCGVSRDRTPELVAHAAARRPVACQGAPSKAAMGTGYSRS